MSNGFRASLTSVGEVVFPTCHISDRRADAALMTQKAGSHPLVLPAFGEVLLCQRPAASYCAATSAAMRPRSLTLMPLCFAHARIAWVLARSVPPAWPRRPRRAVVANIADEQHLNLLGHGSKPFRRNVRRCAAAFRQ